MSILTILSNLLIKPLELVFEFLFSISMNLTGNIAISIVFLSLAINILVLPLYKKADAMQEEARDTDAKLKFWTTHIKKNFKGDERYMILQTYYRQNNYKPTDALRGSVSLLLEVPFFMAAYNFLANLEMIRGQPFGLIQDLGRPDGLLCLWGISINLLPVLMTAINLLSGYIYMKGFPLKAKLQLYGMAAVFLVLLYDSPSALVLYWTLNNVFSLVKNIFGKLKNSKKVISAACGMLGAVGFLFVFLHPLGSIKRNVCAVLLCTGMVLPEALRWYTSRHSANWKEVTVSRQENLLFCLGCGFLALLTGLHIPTAVIANSPEEFINPLTMTNPLQFVLYTTTFGIGIFCIWGSIFYRLSGPAVRRIMSAAVWLISGCAVVDYMFFGKNYGNLSASLQFDVLPAPTAASQIFNMAVLLMAIAVLLLIWLKKRDVVTAVYSAALLAIVGMSLFQIPGIQKASNFKMQEIRNSSDEKPSISLSQKGKNVMVIMMDRAVGLNVPYIIQEKPEIKDQFSGFTYYPKTLSHGANTNIGSPALMGGYEYTPDRINLRSEETLEQKHDEALKVMPVMFHNEGYRVTVLDPPLLGYGVVPWNTVFEDYPDIAVDMMMRKFSTQTPDSAREREGNTPRTIFCYSIFKVTPVFLQTAVYANGTYNKPDEAGTDESGQIAVGISNAYGLAEHFMESYHALEALPQITTVSDTDENTFLFMANDTSHEAVMLKEPEYVPDLHVDNTAYDEQHMDRFVYDGHRMIVDQDIQMRDYHCNMAYMIQLGKWFDSLRAAGVYDNTRIIIVADHGRPVGHFPGLLCGENGDELDILHYNPVLLVKDFNSNSEFGMDLTFMTNADVPALAARGIIDNPLNPFTGRPINSDAKKEPQIVLHSMEHCGDNNTPFYLDAPWYLVNGDMFDSGAWQRLNGPARLPEY